MALANGSQSVVPGDSPVQSNPLQSNWILLSFSLSLALSLKVSNQVITFIISNSPSTYSVPCKNVQDHNWKCSRKKSIFDCGFCSNRILLYFPMGGCQLVTGVTSQVFSII